MTLLNRNDELTMIEDNMIELLDFGFVKFETVENILCFILLAFNIGLEFMDKIEE